MSPDPVVFMHAWEEQRAAQGLEPLACLDLLKFQGQPRPVRRWIVPNIVPERECTLISGDGGEGKTLLQLQLAVACVLGRDWIGRPTRQCRVAAFLCEDDAEEVQIRLSEILDIYGSSFEDVAEDLLIVTRKGCDNMLMHWSGGFERGEPTPLFKRFAHQVTEYGAEVIIIDALHNVFAGNEMQRTHAQQFIDMLASLAAEQHGAVVLSMHPSLTGRKSGTGEAGSTGFRNACRSMLFLTPDPDEPNNRLRRSLRLTKANRTLAGGRIKLEYWGGAFHVAKRYGRD